MVSVSTTSIVGPGEYPNTGRDLINGVDFLWLELTNRCNLQCSHCYSQSGPYESETDGMQLGDWLRLLNDAHALGCRKVQFIGGEPLLYPYLPQLICEARRLDYEFIEVYSNGTRLTDDLVSLFQENRVLFATSFYSDDPVVHDKVTGVRGSQQRTIHALKRALTARIPTRVGIIEMSENELGSESAIAFLRKLGVENIRVDRARGIGRGKSISAPSNPREELCGACWRGSLAVNSAGEVSPCVFSHFYGVGNILQGIGSILGSSLLTDFRYEMRERNKPELPNETRDCQPVGCDPNSGPCAPYCSPIYWCNPRDDVRRIEPVKTE